VKETIIVMESEEVTENEAGTTTIASVAVMITKGRATETIEIDQRQKRVHHVTTRQQVSRKEGNLATRDQQKMTHKCGNVSMKSFASFRPRQRAGIIEWCDNHKNPQI